MSQQPSQGPDHNRKNMAVQYSSSIAPSQNQTLPSFRDLLPAHLHEEIDSAAYYAQSRPAQSRPVPQDRSPEVASFNKSRSAPQQQQQQHHLPHPGTPPPGPVYPSRGPSPILPPLRDFQPAPHARQLERPLSGYDPNPARGLEQPAYAARSSMDDDRFRTSAPFPASSGAGAGAGGGNPGGNGGAPPALYNPSHNHNHSPSPNANLKGYDGGARYGGAPAYASSYTSESEYSPMTHNHTLPASTFGVIGEPLDSRGKRRRGNLPKPVTDILRAWFHEHLDHPYPTEEDKQIFMSRTGLSISQISNWFINARRRQLPALRNQNNQMRNSDGDSHTRGGSPLSDTGASSPGSTSSPSRQRHS